jgi:prepilin-type N-terminal cleavage/methylation domain-containing protein
MRSLNTNAGHRRNGASGFSLTELLIVLAIIIIMVSFAAMNAGPLLKQQHVTNAYNTTLGALRQARDYSVAQSTSYSVTFANNVGAPSTITVTPTTAFNGNQNAVTYTLPLDVTFLALAGIPTAANKVPDGYGTGAVAIDLGYTANGGTGGTNIIYFCPDGSAQNLPCVAAGGYWTSGGYAKNWSGGVVYLAQTGNLLSSRAFTVWGGTGRIHGWRLYQPGGVYQWQRQ